jgi:hypothetical protein
VRRGADSVHAQPHRHQPVLEPIVTRNAPCAARKQHSYTMPSPVRPVSRSVYRPFYDEFLRTFLALLDAMGAA